MPVERTSKGFKDISATFQVNPLNMDLIANKNENAISRSIRNLVFTLRGDKPFQPEIGSNLSALLFELLDELTGASIKEEIEYTITNYEPRVQLNDVRVEPDYDANEFNVTIEYYIIGIEALPQSLTFALQPTR